MRIKTWVIDALGLISLCLFMIFAIFPTSQSYDRYLLIVVPFLLLACFVEKSLFNMLFGNKCWIILGGVLLANVGVSCKNYNSTICSVDDSFKVCNSIMVRFAILFYRLRRVECFL